MRKLLSCLAVVVLTPANWAGMQLDLFVSGINRPVAIAQDPSAADRFFILEHRGTIRAMENGQFVWPFVLDIRSKVAFGGERGLIGIAFHPDYTANGFVYLYYTVADPMSTVIERYTRRPGNPLELDPDSAKIILREPQPHVNHNGGTMYFGEDGYLYVGLGDGGQGYDPWNNAQNPNVLLGKFIRIDVDGDDFPLDPERNYRIPPNNPFLTANPITAAPEIWSFGVRNPWKWSFDPRDLSGTGALLFGDVGEASWEEVNFEPRGAGGRNYGWRVYEGNALTGFTGGAFEPYTMPLLAYNPDFGRSITGGYIYRGMGLGPQYFGRYFFGDFISGQLWSLGLNYDLVTGEASLADWAEHSEDLAGGYVGNIASFGRDRHGELFVLLLSGDIYRLNRSGPATWSPVTVDVAFKGLPSHAARPKVFEVEIWDKSNTERLHQFHVGLNDSDQLRVPVPHGQFLLKVNADTFLRQTRSVTVNAPKEVDVLLPNGDVNGDNVINVLDFLLLRQAFGSSVGDPNYDPRADLVNDGNVGLNDFLVLRLNFGMLGDS